MIKTHQTMSPGPLSYECHSCCWARGRLGGRLQRSLLQSQSPGQEADTADKLVTTKSHQYFMFSLGWFISAEQGDLLDKSFKNVLRKYDLFCRDDFCNSFLFLNKSGFPSIYKTQNNFSLFSKISS